MVAMDLTVFDLGEARPSKQHFRGHERLNFCWQHRLESGRSLWSIGRVSTALMAPVIFWVFLPETNTMQTKWDGS
jgi:hypothetical protein